MRVTCIVKKEVRVRMDRDVDEDEARAEEALMQLLDH